MQVTVRCHTFGKVHVAVVIDGVKFQLVTRRDNHGRCSAISKFFDAAHNPVIVRLVAFQNVPHSPPLAASKPSTKPW